MLRLNRPLLAAALFAFASFVHADAVHLIAPADSATLQGGSFAELQWSAAELPPSSEEWEAFLSIDGGKYYAFRITPHLDIELRRFTFIVPNVTTANARIMIRTGDEKREAAFEAAGSFSIVHDPHAERVGRRLPQFGRGEAAREGDPAVLSWTDGARNGSGLTQQSSTVLPSPSVRRLTKVPMEAPEILPPDDHSADPPALASTRRTTAPRRARKSEPLPTSVDVLLVCGRRNI